MKRALLLVMIVLPLCAQWPPHKDPAIPRTADGKPNLSAPAPKLSDGNVDYSGVWLVDDGRLQFNLMADGPPVALQPEAEKLYQRHLAGLGKERPSGNCMPHSIPDAMMIPNPYKIMHTPGVTLILYEQFVDFRQIYTDGRALPDLAKDAPQPAWFGYSIGRWEKDSFIIETNGFNDKSWLDDDGHPHSESLRTMERFRRTDFGHMTMELTIDDPKTYVKPWSATLKFHLLPDYSLIEFVCENERDFRHLVGK